MQNRIDRHTRLVAWAKIIMPIVALGILSTLFLLSRSIDPIATIPFSEADLEQRTQSQQISEPELFGVTPRGDLISLKADFARQDAENPDQIEAEGVVSQIKLVSGAQVDLSASRATHNAASNTFQLIGNVAAQTSTGYRFEAHSITVSLKALSARSDQPVKGTGPEGAITAGEMSIEIPEGEKDAHILLKSGVKLIYTPQEPKE